jgi:hypothetical protein
VGSQGLWELVEELILWQQASAILSATGFLFLGGLLAWLFIRVRRLEREK